MKNLLFTLMAVFALWHAAQAQDQEDPTAALDRLKIAVQKICPVSGEALGSMGDPVKVQVGDHIAFLCCQGCQSKKIDAELWAQVLANIAKAQTTCPIMGKPISAESKFTLLDGQPIFICCPPCTAKIHADAAGTIEKIRGRYQTYLKAHADK